MPGGSGRSGLIAVSPPLDLGMSDRRQPFGATDALLIFMAVIWGVNYSVVKYGSRMLTPGPFTLLRVVAAAVSLMVVVILQHKPWPAWRDVAGLLALGVLGNGIYQLCFVNGVSRTRIADAALITAAGPACVAVMSVMGRVDRLSPRAIAGIVLSIAGVAFVILTSTVGANRESSGLGALLVMAAMICWSVFTVALRSYTLRVDVVQINAVTMIGGMLPLLAWAPETAAIGWRTLPISVWASVVYAGTVSLGIAYLFWYRGIRVLGPTRTSVYGNLQPVVAIGVAWAVLAETPTVWQMIGAAAILFGIFLTRT